MADTVKTFLIKYDNTSAFGGCLFKIKEPLLREGQTVTKIAAQIGPITKVYSGSQLVYPISVQLTQQESNALDHENPVDILLYDGDGKPQTAITKNRYVVIAGERKVYDDGESD